jgi:hypothetical protein
MKTILPLLLVALLLSCQSEVFDNEKAKSDKIEIGQYPIFVNSDCLQQTVKFKVKKDLYPNLLISLDKNSEGLTINKIDESIHNLLFDIELNLEGQTNSSLVFSDLETLDTLKTIPIKYCNDGDTIKYTSFYVNADSYKPIHIVEHTIWPNIPKKIDFELGVDHEIQSIQTIQDQVDKDSIQRKITAQKVKFINQKNGKTISLPDLELEYSMPLYYGYTINNKTMDYTNIKLDLGDLENIKVTRDEIRLMTEVISKNAYPSYLVQAREIGKTITSKVISCDETVSIPESPIIQPNYIQVQLFQK